jgi:hypothetical protein
MAAVGPCWSCGRTFMFDPERVPSIVADGSRQPLCRDCVQRANELRERQGLARIVPLPGAYVDD